MKCQPISTPLGPYRSIADCARDILQKDPQKFLQDHPNRCRVKFNQMTRPDITLTNHKIYYTVKDLCDDPNIVDWVRVPASSAPASPIIRLAPPVPAAIAMPEMTLAEFLKFGQYMAVGTKVVVVL